MRRLPEQSHKTPRKKIVILGGGFAGLRVALDLAKRHKEIPEYDIVLIDKRDVHIYTPDLYEIATVITPEMSEECLTKLKDTVALPLQKILNGKHVTFMNEHISALDPKQQRITFRSGKKIHYDIAVMVMGSVSNDYGIPGLTQFAYPLKTVKQAIIIHCHLDSYFHYLWKAGTKKEVHIVIGGGGATGVEFAGELPNAIRAICRKYHYSFGHVTITLLQATEELIGAGPVFSRKIETRLRRAGVHVRLNTPIVKMRAGKVTIKHKGKRQTLLADILIWAGGVKPHPFLLRQGLPCEKNGAVRVDHTLKAIDFPNMFAAGDMAAVKDPKTGRPVPWLAQTAIKQGKVLAHNIMATLGARPLKSYKPRVKGIIIPVAGRYAVFKSASGETLLAGTPFWLLRRLIDLYYVTTILPFPYACKKWWHDTNIFMRNDKAEPPS